MYYENTLVLLRARLPIAGNTPAEVVFDAFGGHSCVLAFDLSASQNAPSLSAVRGSPNVASTIRGADARRNIDSVRIRPGYTTGALSNKTWHRFQLRVGERRTKHSHAR
jgi:hypothetical protein